MGQNLSGGYTNLTVILPVKHVSSVVSIVIVKVTSVCFSSGIST